MNTLKKQYREHCARFQAQVIHCAGTEPAPPPLRGMRLARYNI